MALVIASFKGQDLRTRLPDDSILVGNGYPVMRIPEFAISEDGRFRLPIATIRQPRQHMPGDPDLIITPELDKPAETTAEFVCPHCKTRQVMRGWSVITPPIDYYPNLVVQCPNCYNYHWVYSPALEQFLKEHATNWEVGVLELRENE